MAQNHVLDPTFFYDAIAEFAFDYDLYRVTGQEIDECGFKKSIYEHCIINGSLQSKSKRLVQSKSGNTYQIVYEFYCKSLYRINTGDFIVYKNRYLRVNDVYDFDEYGVRSCELIAIQLSDYKDFAEYLKYINGEAIV